MGVVDNRGLQRALGAFVAGVVAIAALLATASPADACTCATLTLSEKIAKSDVAFVGREIDRRAVETRPGTSLPRFEVTFVVETVLMGNVGQTFIAVTNGNPAICGIGPLVDRGSVGIVASDYDGLYPISACGGVYNSRVLEAEFGDASSAPAAPDGLRAPGPTGVLVPDERGPDERVPADGSDESAEPLSALDDASAEQPNGISSLLPIVLISLALLAGAGFAITRRTFRRRSGG